MSDRNIYKGKIIGIAVNDKKIKSKRERIMNIYFTEFFDHETSLNFNANNGSGATSKNERIKVSTIRKPGFANTVLIAGILSG